MRRIKLGCALLGVALAVGFAPAATARVVTVEGGGVVQSAVNATTVGVNQPVSFTFSFDTESLTFLRADNSDTNVYVFKPLSFSGRFGSYDIVPSLASGALVLNRGFAFLGGMASERVLNQTFALGALGAPDAPFGLAGGVARMNFNFNSTFRSSSPTPAIDLSALTDPAEAFRSNFILGATPVANGPRGSLFGPATGAFVAGGVPEPRTWALLILGSGAIAGRLRRRATRAAFA